VDDFAGVVAEKFDGQVLDGNAAARPAEVPDELFADETVSWGPDNA
jgi:hypothetical protein